EHDSLSRAGFVVEHFDFSRRSARGTQRIQVPRQARLVPVSNATDRRHRTHAEAEVVTSTPVAEVVPGAKVATLSPFRPETEVRCLVPAVARRRQRVDDPLEVVLHRVALPPELLAVETREAGARLCL